MKNLNLTPQKQTKHYTLLAYVNAGCETLTRDGKEDDIGASLHAVTRGMPCNDCPLINNNCKALAKLRAGDTTPVNTTNFTAYETVREEADRRGISIGEVRRQRNERNLLA